MYAKETLNIHFWICVVPQLKGNKYVRNAEMSSIRDDQQR